MLKQSRKSGFTLLELLIVVIIVSILAAVAMPRFTRMTRRARAAEAVAAIGAVLTAEQVYYQENNTTFSNNYADLLVDLNTVNFSYAAAPVLSNGNLTVAVATQGQAGTPAAGIIVTGTITNTGTRTVTPN